MSAGKMHADELTITIPLVQRLLAAQFPHWADLPLTAVKSAGTDNAIYRLGAELVVRLPRIGWAIGQVAKEHKWLPRLAPHLPLAIPEPLAQGEPGAGYPWRWSIYRWLPGENVSPEAEIDWGDTAVSLAGFVKALQQIDPAGGPLAETHGLRGLPLLTRDEAVREAIGALNGRIDTKLALKAWQASLEAPDWHRLPVWFHGDLLPGNVLFYQGKAHAVIDFGGLGVGDPACDLMIAWGLFTGQSRTAFRAALGVDEATWRRGRGQALAQALIFLPYYWRTNPTGVQRALWAVQQVLADFQVNG